MTENERRRIKKDREQWTFLPPRWAYPETIGKEEYSIGQLVFSIAVPLIAALFLLGVAHGITEDMRYKEALLIKHLLPLTYLAMLIPSFIYAKYIQLVTGEKSATPETIVCCSIFAGIACAPLFSVAAIIYIIL